MNRIAELTPKILVLITDGARAKKAEDILRASRMPVQYRFRGTGTASSEIMDYLGLDGNEKIILFTIVPQRGIDRIAGILAEKLKLEKPGHGILFTVPVSGISNPAMQLLDESIKKDLHQKVENEVAKMAERAKYSLVIAITDRGYSEEVMETAKSAGAKGGTVTNARRLGLEEAMQLWGIRIQDEREIIAIVADKDTKANIMRAIGEKHGIKSEARGLILSIPVEDMIGMV